MNFLAHLYLSGNNEQIIFGNFLGDFIKGKQYQQFEEDIQKGILLHRFIDYFADNHKISKESRKYVRKNYRKYAGIVIDVFYDHFLAKNFEKYSTVPLNQFAKNAHLIIDENYKLLPINIQNKIPFIIRKERLISYKNISGIKKSLFLMGQFTSLPNESSFAISQLKNNYNQLQLQFEEFFHDITNSIKKEWDIIL